MEINKKEEPSTSQNYGAAQLDSAMEFMLFLASKVTDSMQQFSENVNCTTEESKVIELLAQRGTLMVKEVAASLENISVGSLTRLLDRMEDNGYITRNLNRQDRRSFQIQLTEKGNCLSNQHRQVMREQALHILNALTPAERLILLELFSKITANWEDDLPGGLGTGKVE